MTTEMDKPPMIYQLTHKKPTEEQDNSYVFLKGSSRLTGTIIHVIDGAGDQRF